MSPPVVSVVLGSYDRHAFLKGTIASVRDQLKATSYELIVVDGGSTDGAMEWLAKQKDVVTIVQHNRGNWRGRNIEQRSWGYFMNLGFKIAQGKYICMISDDCVLVPGAIANAVDLFEEMLAAGKKVGAMAFSWRDWPAAQPEYWVGTVFGKPFVNHGLYLRSALEEVNWIDEERYRFYYADGDLCLRLWERGYSVELSPHSYVEHASHVNTRIRAQNSDHEKRDREAFLQRWNHLRAPGMTDVGGSLRRNFIDHDHSFRQFPLVPRMWLILRTRISGTLRRIRGEARRLLADRTTK